LNKVKKSGFITRYINPRRKEGKIPKLQRDWEGPYVVVRKLSGVVYCIRRSNKHKSKVVHSDRLASFYKRRK